MYYKLIACEVFTREISAIIAETPNTIDVNFMRLGAHADPIKLKALIQEKIYEANTKDYDAVLLAYGLCGNTTDGIKAGRHLLVIPRAHDCCTIFLGSKERFNKYFGNRLSARWTSAGYMERGDNYLQDSDVGRFLGQDIGYQDLVKQYGEENAKYIQQMLKPKDLSDKLIVFIDTPISSHLNYKEQLEKKIKGTDKKLEVIPGNEHLLKGLLSGEWNRDEYLVVQPGYEICAVYDKDEIFKAKK